MTPLILRPYEVVIWGESKLKPLCRLGVQSFSEDEAKASALAQFRGQADWITNPFPTVTRIEVLSDVHVLAGRKQQTLFEDIADVCLGHSLSDIQGAMVNMLITAVQRRYVKVGDATARWDELMGRGKVALEKRFRKEVPDEDAVKAWEIGQRLVG